MVKSNNQKPVGNMDKCPIDGTLFEVVPANQKYCSPKCKRIADSEKRRQKKFAARYAEYKRLKNLLGFAADDNHNLRAIEKDYRLQSQTVKIQARVIIALFLSTALFVVLWLAK